MTTHSRRRRRSMGGSGDAGQAPAHGSPRLIETDSLHGWERQWDDILDGSPKPTYSLRSWWLEQANQRPTLFLLVVQGEKLLGGLGLELERWHGLNRYRVVGDSMWPADYDIVMRPESSEIVTSILGSWFQRSEPHVLELRGLNPDTLLRSVLSGSFTVEESSPRYSIEIPEQFSDYMSQISRSLRREIGRRKRQLADAGYELRRIPDDEIGPGLEALERLHRMQFGASSNFLPFYSSFRAAGERAAKYGELLLFEVMDSNGESVAVDALMIVRSRAFGFIGGRSPQAHPGTGTALRAHLVEAMCLAGVSEFDFGGGFADWKQRWAPNIRPQLRIRGASGVPARALVRLRDTVANLRRRGKTPGKGSQP